MWSRVVRYKFRNLWRTVLSPSSGSNKTKATTKKENILFAALFCDGYFLDLYFDPEDEDNVLHRNICELLLNYIVSRPKEIVLFFPWIKFYRSLLTARETIEDVQIDKYRHFSQCWGQGAPTMQFHFYYYGSSNSLNERSLKRIFHPSVLFHRLNVLTSAMVPLAFEQYRVSPTPRKQWGIFPGPWFYSSSSFLLVH